MTTPEALSPKAAPAQAKIKLIHSDGHFLAAHKPIGMATYQESKGQGAHGLKEILEDQLNQRLFPVHRIDADTSGVVLFALDSKSAAALVRLFKEHQVHKTYTAWCVGDVPEKGTIGSPLKKHKSEIKENARTDYLRMKKWNGFSLVKVFPQTGRFHQIRRHFESIKHPLVGDPKYGSKAAWGPFFKGQARLMLQAESVEFISPFNKKPVKIQTKEKLSEKT
jgi:tRNA pseudouridine65 synthase